MPLTSAHGADDFGNPYEEMEAQDQVTQDSEEETVEEIAETPDVVSEPETVENIETPDEIIARQQSQITAQASHIGVLEGENAGFRRVTDQYATPEPEPELPKSIFDDENTQTLMRAAYEEDPMSAMELVGRHIEKETRERLTASEETISQDTAEQQRLNEYSRLVNQELADAASSMAGGKEIVEEYLASNGTSGRLVERIHKKGESLRAMGANPQLAAAPGNFKSAIAEILVEGIRPGTAPVTVRPKGRNEPRQTAEKPETDTISEEDAYGDAIVAAEGPRDKIASILKPR